MVNTSPPANSNQRMTDLALPFIIESNGIRGRLVRLGEEIDHILTDHGYPEVASQALGELLVLAAMLGTMMKIDGIITIQVQGDGALPFVVADYTSKGHLRGYAKVDDKKTIDTIAPGASVEALCGKGYIVITIEHKDNKPYQAIVPLEGERLAECIITYFKQSEQLEAMVEVAVAKLDGAWKAAGILLQRVALEGGKSVEKEYQEHEQAWEQAGILMQTVTADEMLDEILPPYTLLYRLFHEDGVRVYDSKVLKAQCRCSRDKVVTILENLPEDEIEAMKKDGVIEVTCRFCNTVRYFNDGDW